LKPTFFLTRRVHAPPGSPEDRALRLALRDLVDERFPVPAPGDDKALRTPLVTIWTLVSAPAARRAHRSATLRAPDSTNASAEPRPGAVARRGAAARPEGAVEGCCARPERPCLATPGRAVRKEWDSA